MKPAPAFAAEHPEARLYDETREAGADVDNALAAGADAGKTTLIVMGANWCHDSRALAGWFTTDIDIIELLDQSFIVTYVDVGQKNRNIDIANRFGIEKIVGTPTMVMVAPDGTVLNAESAVTWRNSASRTKAEILTDLQAAVSN